MDRCNVIVDKRTPEFIGNKNALSKARKDVETVCVDMGFIPNTIVTRSFSVRLCAYIYNLWQYIKAIARTPFCSNVYIQFPAPFSRTAYYKWFMLAAKAKKCRLSLIIHDVESLRYHSKEKQVEIGMINMADSVIVHTEAMKQALTRMGVKVNMVILNIFDYCTDSNMPEKLVCDKIVAFAGNLEKSPFLKKLIEKDHDILYRLYGKSNPFYLENNTHIEYCGSFLPEQVDSLQASWGLVWDGDSIETCAGVTGNYLCYNSPHKLSLYIAAGMPVIVWENSAVAKFVISNNIGICVKDLNELGEIISTMPHQQYERIVKSVQTMSRRLRSGSMLKEAMKKTTDRY